MADPNIEAGADAMTTDACACALWRSCPLRLLPVLHYGQRVHYQDATGRVYCLDAQSEPQPAWERTQEQQAMDTARGLPTPDVHNKEDAI